MHSPGHLRDPLIEAFTDFDGEEWFLAFPSKRKALRVLGRLWNSTDAVPSDVRREAADWLEWYGVEPYLSHKVRGGCSFAQLVRVLRPMIQETPDWNSALGEEQPRASSAAPGRCGGE